MKQTANTRRTESLYADWIYPRYNGSISGNRLSSVSALTDALPFDGMTGVGLDRGSMAVTYDASGRMSSDARRGIVSVSYDNDGHTVRTVFKDGNEQRDVWDGLGNHLATKYYNRAGASKDEPYLTKTYAGDGQIEITLGPALGSTGSYLSYTSFPDGYFDQDGTHYYITDHQGNHTAVIDSSPKITEENNYYPYGEPWRENNGDPFMFSGNERLLIDGLNDYDFHARRYNAAVPAFASWDTLNEQYPWLSPYAYCAGNPINMTDRFGLRIIHNIDGINYEYSEKDDIWAFYNAQGERYIGTTSMFDALESIRNINKLGEEMIDELVASQRTIKLSYSSNENSFIGKDGDGDLNVFWNPDNKESGIGISNTGEVTRTRNPLSGLAHELGHAYDYILPSSPEFFSPGISSIKNIILSNHMNVDPFEVIPCIVENSVRYSVGDPIRKSYFVRLNNGNFSIDYGTYLNFSHYDYFLLLHL